MKTPATNFRQRNIFRALLLMGLLSTILPQFSTAHAQGTAFTYQGRLNNGTNLASGIYDLRFALYNAVTAGTQQGVLITNLAATVSNGLFTATLDFGNQFLGTGRWLEIGVRTNGSGTFGTLTPRQSITPTPYAITAGTVVSGGLSSGTYGNAVTFNNAANSFSGNGAGLTSLNASQLTSGTVPDARLAANIARTNQVWLLAGNAGITSGAHFLGTTDNTPVEFKVNNQRALRLEYVTGQSVNIIGGYSGNYVGATVQGATIGGGGAISYSNSVLNNFGTVSGGINNTAGGIQSAVGGGVGNKANAYLSTVAGGFNNTANMLSSTVSGGERNIASGVLSKVGGGSDNIASGTYSSIGGGQMNVGGGGSSTVGGGANNTASNSITTIGGGEWNFITNASFAGGLIISDSTGSSIPGGSSNTVVWSYSTIGGGSMNIIAGSASFGYGFSTIGGGITNRILAGYACKIGGGAGNRIVSDTSFSTVGGGLQNFIGDESDWSVIGGGKGNYLDGTGGTIAGGTSNRLDFLSDGCSVGGGNFNFIGSSAIYSTISGGYSNTISGAKYATIPGGYAAKALSDGQMAYASGLFVSTGDAQTSVYVARNTSTNATPIDLFLGGGFSRINVPANSTWTYDILVTGRTAGGSSAGYQIRGVIENNAGTTALVGSPTVTVLAEDVAAWDATVVADNSFDTLVVRVTGAAATTVRWVASVRTVEVTF